MSQIRRQGIIASIVISIGFAIGFVNNYLFGRAEWFTTAEYGLTRSFFDFGQVIFAASFWGMSAVGTKFFPYYKAHAKEADDDLLTLMLVIPLIGFLLFLTAGIVFESYFIKKFGENSPLLVHYYYWLYPFGLGLLFFAILEAYCWNLKRSVLSGFMKETVLRLLTSALIMAYIFKWISYDQFIKIFSFLFLILTALLIGYLKQQGQFRLVFKTSWVTKKFRKKMMVFGLFIFAGSLCSTVAASIDSIIIAALIGQVATGVFAFSSYVSTLIQIPQRSVIAVTLPVLASAWRDKNLPLISTIYKRSSINLLLAALFIFGNIWLCFREAISTLHLKANFLDGQWLAFFLGLKLIIDMGTGLNGQIIITSKHWRFEFITGILLLALMGVLNYFLVKKMGIVGSGISNLVAYTIYNVIRIGFLWHKYRMQPFTINTLKALLVALLGYLLTWYSTQALTGWAALICRCTLYSGVFAGAVWYWNLTPDLQPVLRTIRKRLGMGKA